MIIAMALACSPRLIVLDEPTTGLDVTTQAQILDLLVGLRDEIGVAMLYISHNLGVVAQICTRIGVMYAGALVEVAPTGRLFHPRHPYTQGLISSVPRSRQSGPRQRLLLRGLLVRSELPVGCRFAPRCEFAETRCHGEPQALARTEQGDLIACWKWRSLPSFGERLSKNTEVSWPKVHAEGELRQTALLEVDNLSGGYSRRKRGALRFKSIEDVTFDIPRGLTFALVGEFGSGKTTLARALSGLLPWVAGHATLQKDSDLTISLDRRNAHVLRCVQLVFQNPDASL